MENQRHLSVLLRQQLALSILQDKEKLLVAADF
jgi:hypothetical protein